MSKMNKQSDIPSFEEWLNYCFNQAYEDTQIEYNDPRYPEAEVRNDKYCDFSPSIITEYLIRFYKNPSFVMDQYSSDEIAWAIHFMFFIESEFIYTVLFKDVPEQLQIDFVLSVGNLYMELFDPLCLKTERQYPQSKICDVVYMLWDASGIENVLLESERLPHLTDPGFEILETVLTRCTSETCMNSALHGLGHVHEFFLTRTEQVIDQFLLKRSIPSSVRKFAYEARVGNVL